MSLKEYLKDKSLFLGINIFLDITLAAFLLFIGVKVEYVALVFLVWIFPLITFVSIEFMKRRDYYNSVKDIFESLDKKYLLSEVIEKPDFIDGKIIYEILRKTDREMHEHIKYYRNEQIEYREYIETWVHEVKTPIASSKLIIDNNKNHITNNIKEELDKVEEYIEQVLYYSRSKDANKDYIIKEFELNSIIKRVIAKNSKDFIHKKIKLELNNVDETVFSDIKWSEFIINQVIVNSIKYCDKENSKIEIYSKKSDNSVILSIRDNGIGISEKDIKRIFDKSFTGENGRKFGKSTGMGLYICKKLSKKLSLGLEVQSEKGSWTKVDIIFPRSKAVLLED